MLNVRPCSPVDYSKCNQTVTVYHRAGEAYTRTVYNKAFLDFKKTESVDKTGSREAKMPASGMDFSRKTRMIFSAPSPIP